MALHYALLTSPSPAAIGPDAAIIEACNAFSDICIELQTCATGDVADALQPDLDAAFERMFNGRATTLEGFTGRARALAIYQEEGACAHGPWPDAMLDILLRDMLGLPGSGSDLELINLCADFEANERQIRAIYNGPGRMLGDDEAARAAAAYEARVPVMLDRMAELRASTAAGIHARVRVLAAVNGDAAFSVDGQGASPRLYAYLCRDARALQIDRRAG